MDTFDGVDAFGGADPFGRIVLEIRNKEWCYVMLW